MGSYAEPGVDPATVIDAAAAELQLLGRWLGLEHLAVAPRGGLARGLRAAVTRGRRAVPT
jgi:uncharacterized protein YcaQ